MTDDERAIKDWVDGWGAEVAAVRLSAARRRFADEVGAFGTHADVDVGLDALFDDQWSQVWPTIEDFRFLTDDMRVQFSPDGLVAIAIVGWTSIGIAEDGVRFARPGRATVVLQRRDHGGEWLGTHTHFSLGRDVPSSSHGGRDPA